MTRTLAAVAALALLLVLFLGVNILASRPASVARIDLTEGRLFTLSQGARSIARSPKEPVTLTLYVSDGVLRKLANPGLQSHARRVREVADEFRRASGGKIELVVVDPEPFSEAEDKAVAAGLAGIPAGGGDTFYLGLVGTNSTDGMETIPYFDPNNQRMIEYDIARLVHTLADTQRKAVGLITSLPMKGGFQMDPRTGRPAQTPAWMIHRELKALFDLREIEATATSLPDGLDLLILAHPKNLSDDLLFSIDQFVLRGGRLIAFLDPLCETDVPPGDPMQSMGADRSSTLPRLLEAWGVEVSAGQIVGDMKLGLPVNAPNQRGGDPVPYVAWINAGREELSGDDPATAQLSRVIFASAGEVRIKPDAPGALTLTPIASSSEQSMLIDAAKLSFMPDPRQLLAEFLPSGQSRAIIARLSGNAVSAFPEGKPTPPPPEGETGPQPPPPGEWLKESAGPVNIIVAADADILSDRYWIRQQDIGLGVPIVSRVSDNGDLVINAVDNMTGSADLISVRARGQYARPFDRITELERNAQQQYQAEQQRLEQSLRDTEAKIAELQQKRPDGSDAVFLTPEQQKEIEGFRAQMVDTRRQLREVQLNLRKDVESLGDALRLANIAVVPLAVMLIAAVVGLARSSRRAGARKAARA